MGKDVVNYDKAWADEGRKEVERAPTTTSSFLSTRGGTFRLGEDEVEGNGLVVVITANVFENSWYDKPWSPDQKVVPPRCFALSENAKDLEPHPAMAADEEVFTPQNDECASCPKNQWGSAERGKGKACSNRRRLSLIPAGQLVKVKGSRNEYTAEFFEDEADYLDSQQLLLKLPVTSGKSFSHYVKELYKSHQRPPHSVITRINLVPDPKSQYKVEFELVELLPGDFYNTLTARHKEGLELALRPYTPEED